MAEKDIEVRNLLKAGNRIAAMAGYCRRYGVGIVNYRRLKANGLSPSGSACRQMELWAN